MNFARQTDEGVSPVVGVVLMVAITVILAAIIATFVLGLGGTVNQNPQAGVTFDQATNGQIDTTDDGTNNPDTQEYRVTVQVVSMENADSVGISATDTDNTQYDASPGDSSSGLSAYDPTVSTSSLSSVGASSDVSQLTENDKLTITATLEGKTQVIQTYTVLNR